MEIHVERIHQHDLPGEGMIRSTRGMDGHPGMEMMHWDNHEEDNLYEEAMERLDHIEDRMDHIESILDHMLENLLENESMLEDRINHIESSLDHMPENLLEK
jgi:hypothetical protein